MNDFRNILLPDEGQDATQIHLIDKAGFDDWLAAQPESVREAVAAQGFRGASDSLAWLPGSGGRPQSYVAGIEKLEEPGPWALASLAASLPGGNYRLVERSAGASLLGWLLAHYRFDEYRKASDEAKPPRILLTGDVAKIEEAERRAQGIATVRDLVNMPAADMGPEQIEQRVAALAKERDAELTVTRGEQLKSGFPLIHAVGRGATRDYAPRLVELEWGRADHPRIAVVGKGVSFDSGGLDIKSSAGMRIMKKDMGGAAHAIALAGMIMAARLPVRLHLLIPTVENAISGDSFRPGDVIRSRSGQTVEIENTDAEGRLILADALTRAGEESPQLILDFATLTGAARVALGPDLPALFANDDGLADQLLASGLATGDPLWRLPLHAPYFSMLKSSIADMANSAKSGFAGASTAALFLEKFVSADTPWAHLDTYAWRGSSAPGRPEGGEALGLIAAYEALRVRFAGSA